MGARRRLLDAIVLAWTALWILAGVAVWHEVRGLRPMVDTLGVAGVTLGDTADVLRGVASVPLVGGSLRRVADDATRTALSAQASARRGRRSVDRLALLLGIALPAIAVVPPVAGYALLGRR
ncbi:MAG TPA: hypothetical protein VE982_03440 [Gaiellaceae bacterium]|nr:hypothetical protein [Gaiellaceae bacterium]